MSNLAQIASAIVASEVTAEQKRLAVPLVERYIDRFKDDAKKFKVLAVENPWYMWLDDHTCIVGVMDANRYDIEHERYEDLELKTRRAPRFKNNGEPYKGDTEQDWMNELAGSPQVGIYALARTRATFLSPLPPVGKPMIRVRAAVKSDGKVNKPSPIMIWPSQDDGLFTFSEAYLKQVESGLLNAAHAIRALREYATFPWQMMGNWCTHFGKPCVFKAKKLPNGSYEDGVCTKGLNGDYVEPLTHLQRTDPGAQAIEAALKEYPSGLASGRNLLVILSASAYGDFAHCAELWRLKSGGWFEKEESDAMNVGTAFHAGCAEFNRSML